MKAFQVLEKQLLAVCTVLVFSQSVFSGRIAYNRETTLGELRSIDGLVSSGLPVFNNGFFISTRNGPVLVKNQAAPGDTKPKLNPGYYFTLPRVIPTGYEGIATTSFNLGSAIPVQPSSSHLNRNIIESHPYPQPQQSVINEQRALFPPTQNRFQSGNVNLPGPQQSYSTIQQTHPVPSHQNSFQFDNGLSPGSDQQISALGGSNHFGSGPQKHVTNEVVEQTIAYEESLPEEYRNPFYRNANLASTLASSSLPIQGEEVVYNWDTNKIAKGKIHALLRGAGFI